LTSGSQKSKNRLWVITFSFLFFLENKIKWTTLNNWYFVYFFHKTRQIFELLIFLIFQKLGTRSYFYSDFCSKAENQRFIWLWNFSKAYNQRFLQNQRTTQHCCTHVMAGYCFLKIIAKWVTFWNFWGEPHKLSISIF
jgi:hypothetical protein